MGLQWAEAYTIPLEFTKTGECYGVSFVDGTLTLIDSGTYTISDTYSVDAPDGAPCQLTFRVQGSGANAKSINETSEAAHLDATVFSDNHTWKPDGFVRDMGELQGVKKYNMTEYPNITVTRTITVKRDI